MSRIHVGVVLFLACPAIAFAQAPCSPQWTAGLFSSGDLPISIVLQADATAFDEDGPGPLPPALYAGVFEKLYKWTPLGWVTVATVTGPTAVPTITVLEALDEDGPGPLPAALFMGGHFTSVSGVPCNGLARWNGTTWSAMGSFAGGTGTYSPKIAALATFDEDGAGPLPTRLFAGGDFVSADGAVSPCIARWNGAAWIAVGTGMTGSIPLLVRTLAVHDEDGAGPAAPALFA